MNSMKAELNDGSIIQLKDECERRTFQGPRFVYDSDQQRERNLNIINPYLDFIHGKKPCKTLSDKHYVMYIFHFYCKLERERLARLREEMERRQIKRVIREDTGEVRESNE